MTLPIWVGDVYHLENSFIQIYKHCVFQLETCFYFPIFPFPAFLLAKIDAKPEQTRYERFVKLRLQKRYKLQPSINKQKKRFSNR